MFTSRLFLLLLPTLFVFGLGTAYWEDPPVPQDPPVVADEPAVIRADIPQMDREFRGVWIATVSNIDWPSRPGLSTEAQQAELVALLDRAVALNLNTVVLQVRPAADAFYQSSLEPWSEFLTGKMGRAPEPFYDPLDFAVTEAHRRGLELHAWFNPYRARSASRSEADALHISRQYPEVVKPYGKFLWIDPGVRMAEDHTLAVIQDVVRRYDIDGVHLDDYFYPYQEVDAAGRVIPFPDNESWAVALAGGEVLGRDDWRRQNVDRFVERLYAMVKEEKPWVKVGISPFGIWRPGHPARVRGLDAFASLYADSRKWLMNGWVDYFSPQLYWRSDRENLNYAELLQWWDEQNIQQRHLWPGNYTSRVGSMEGENWHPNEIIIQILLTRAQLGASGNIHFSMVSLMKNRRNIGEALTDEVYATPALVPATPWLAASLPTAPRLEVFWQEVGGLMLRMRPSPRDVPWLWVVRYRYQDQWLIDKVPGWKITLPLTSQENPNVPDEVAVSMVDRLGNESPVTMLGSQDLRERSLAR